MNIHISEKEQIIKYYPSIRAYAIQIKKFVIQKLKYCPWCGIKLSKDLSDTRSKIIFDELKLDSYDDPRLPPVFHTDEWWKKRGL